MLAFIQEPSLASVQQLGKGVLGAFAIAGERP